MLVDLPPEIIENVLLFLDPVSVACFSQTCRTFFTLIYEIENQALWRSLFLQDEHFDDPHKCFDPLGEPMLADGASFDWRRELQRRIQAQNVISNPSRPRSEDDLLRVLDTLLFMVLHTPHASYEYKTEDISRNLVWLVARRELGNFIEGLHARQSELSHELHQRASRLHTYMGCTTDDFSRERRIKTRAYVYDMRHYTEATNWGPFESYGGVNWEHLLAIQNVMAMHVVAPESMMPEGHQVLSLLPYCQAQLPKQVAKEDWAGVEGIWTCSFCFIDHRDLLAYNATDPRDTFLFEQPEFVEVFRQFRVLIRFIGSMPNPKYPTRPTILFRGNVQDVHIITGTIRVADDGTIRWSFTSGEQTQMIWSSEGVQIGVAQSSFGVLGTWTTVFHEDGDPIGPFWLRKEIEDEQESENT